MLIIDSFSQLLSFKFSSLFINGSAIPYVKDFALLFVFAQNKHAIPIRYISCYLR